MSRPISFPQLRDPLVLIKLMRDFGTDKAIAREVGCATNTVKMYRQRMGWYKRESRGAPVKYPQLHDPVELKRLMDECGTYAEVARKIGCDDSTVCKAVLRMTEAEIDEQHS